MRRSEGELRIIGGEFRSRVIRFEAAPGVRATPDRVRQALFDWLAPMIVGARCLDLFAGSGALGLEALSRGASHVSFVDTGAAQGRAIREALKVLKAEDRATVVTGDALSFLASAPKGAIDAVFLDPPFESGLLQPALQRLPPLLAPDNRVYAEWAGEAPLAWPAGYAPLREKKAGQVSYALAEFRSAEQGPNA